MERFDQDLIRELDQETPGKSEGPSVKGITLTRCYLFGVI